MSAFFASIIAASRRRPGGGAGDPFWNSVVSLLHFDTDFTDQKGKIWTTSAGSPVIVSDAESSGGVALSLDGSSEIRTPTGMADFNFPAGTDFTVELFVKPTVITSTRGTFGGTSNNTFSSGLNGGGHFAGPFGVSFGPIGSPPLTVNQRIHIAAARQGSTMRVFHGGVLAGSATDTFNYSQPSEAAIGILSVGNRFAGLIDELRVTKGVARYTANFTPPTGPFPNGP